MADAVPDSARPGSVKELGLFNAESLYVRFDFTRDALTAAAQQYFQRIESGAGQEMPEELKTYVHELTHYLHYTTTPYGLFLQYCRVLQSRAAIEIVQALLAAGAGFRVPILENVPMLRGETEALVQRGLSMWLNIENLLLTMHADTERRAKLLEKFLADAARFDAGQRPRLPPLLDLRSTFLKVQESMADLLESNNAAAAAAGNPVPMEPAGFDRDALRNETNLLPTSEDWAMLRLQDALDLLGSPWSTAAVIESAATAAEFWGTAMDYESFVAWAHAKVDPQLQVYRTCIAQGLASIQTRRLQEFIPTYLTLCELALYAPLLPHHAGLRRKRPDFRQILPVQRWMELMRVAGEIAPMRAMWDHDRYVMEICRTLDWVHPTQIIRVAVDGPERVSNPLAYIYVSAQRWRAHNAGVFIDAGRFLFDSSPQGEEWRDLFNFVILDYADRTMYHRDKGFLQSMTTRHLNMLGMRALMVGNSLAIPAPYRGDDAEREWMTSWLRERFRALFGRDFPELQFV